MRISDFSIKRPVFTIVTMFLVLILGAVSFIKIPVTLIPELNPPVAVVVTSYPGASPEEVSEKVTKPLEASLSTLPGLKRMQSSSQEGANLIFLEFDWSSHIDDVQTDVMQRIDSTMIPDDANKPLFMKFDPSQFPIIQMSLTSGAKGEDVRLIAEELEKELRRIEGVASVNISGSLVEEIQIVLKADKLEERGLTQSDIVQVIQSNNISMPGEPVQTDEGQRLTTRILSTLTSVEEIADLTVTVNPLNGEKVMIKDIAEVKLAEPQSNTETRANREPAVLLSVLQESGTNTASVSKEFKSSLDELLKKDEYKSIHADILFDQGDYVQLAINNIGSSLILGGIFAMLVLFVFLRGVRSPLIIGVAIPYSVIVTFVLMYFADFALNIMTLGALALGIGMLVDNAIVVIENIERHLTLGKSPKQAASEGTKEVGTAITASTLTTIAVFVPVIFISGLIGQIFLEFALTISFSLLASLAVALTVIPMMASRLLRKPKGNLEARRRRSKAYNNFERSIKWSLGHRVLMLVFTVILLIASVFGIIQVGTEFLPPTDEGFVSANVRLENGSSLEATKEVVNSIEDRLELEEDIDVFVSLVGGTQQDQAQGTMRAHMAEIYIKLVPLDERNRSVFEFVDDVQPEIVEMVGERAEVRFNLQSAAGSQPNSLTFTVTDSDAQRLNKTIDMISAEMEKLPNVLEVTNNVDEKVEEVNITVDRAAANEFGIAPVQLAQLVNNATRGVPATQIITEEDEVYSVFVQYEPELFGSVEQLSKMKIRTPAGQFIELQQVADVSVAEGPISIRRIDQSPSVSFTIRYTSSETLGGMTDVVNERLEALNLPKETDISYGGDRELFEESIDDMILAVLLAVVLVYIVMAAQFESFNYPFVIMFTVPLMIIGVALGLVSTQTPLSIPSVIGILILIGIVVNNGIVLVDYINQRKSEGLSTDDAIVVSTRDRVRPILMTALTTILGLIPIALGLGEGTEINQPMGIVVIGGLVSSTFLTLYIVPIVYSLFDRRKKQDDQ
ncbi:efflux RND transporter permease subunit [Chungangia koreensis]|uniref:Efflux RND transporter permease subunit n=1 Tax=Chungangia koreensis TaxID=752657 RepID=A0ABV8X0G4_9LACT